MNADEHGHGHGDASHGHAHGVVDPSLLTSEQGIRALKWSLAGLSITAALQVVVVAISGSVALLADTIHNFGDAGTAIPLWVAFRKLGARAGRRGDRADRLVFGLPQDPRLHAARS